MKKYAVSSICNALMDVLIEVSDDDIKKLGLTKGVMHLVESARQSEVLGYFPKQKRTVELGGSSMNAIRALAALGEKTFFAGCISDDDFGKQIQERMNTLGIEFQLGNSAEPTGTCLILISPDGERTMNTHLGASRLYTPSHIPTTAISQSKVFHFSGYQWDTDDQKKAIYKAIRAAKEEGTVVSFDVADPFVVQRHREDFLKLIREDADIVFANKEETRLLFETDAAQAARKITECDAIAVLKLGGEGALVASKDQSHKIHPVKTTVIDTTAAGDMFAAGFLYGYLSGCSLETSGKIAATLASDVISRIGAKLSDQALQNAKSIAKAK